MKKAILYPLLLCGLSMSLITRAQKYTLNESPGSGDDLCLLDSFKTSLITVSTGVGADASSDSILMNCGYGYNTAYPSPNDNRDSFWRVAKLSSVYNPRPTYAGITYTGPYLSPGGQPFILCVKGTVLDGYYETFDHGGTCITPSSTYKGASNWISVYGDCGGQNAYIKNSVGDGYAYERCFYICQDDTVNIDLKLFSDDIIDTVQLDTTNLYIASSTSTCCQYTCGKEITIKKTIALAGGRHILRIWTRDNAGGHLGLNVYGHIQSSGGKKNIIQSRFDSQCSYEKPSGIAKAIKSAYQLEIVPNPSNNSFSLNGDIQSSFDLLVMDLNGRVLYHNTDYQTGKTIQTNFATGVYIIRAKGEKGDWVDKLLIE